MLKQRILVADDDRSIVKIVRGYLDQAGYETLTAHDGETALHILRREKPDLAILDIMMPGRDGLNLTQLIRGDASLGALPVILLTAKVDDVDKILGLEMGADDYITKPFNGREVVARVKAALRRNDLAQQGRPRILILGELHLDVNKRELQLAGQRVELTPAEFGILQALMERAGHTLTREELLEQSVGYAYEGMGRTLDTHIRNLRKKIEHDPKNPKYIETVFRVGYRMREGGDE